MPAVSSRSRTRASANTPCSCLWMASRPGDEGTTSATLSWVGGVGRAVGVEVELRRRLILELQQFGCGMIGDDAGPTLLVDGAKDRGAEARPDLGERALLLERAHHEPAQLLHIIVPEPLHGHGGGCPGRSRFSIARVNRSCDDERFERVQILGNASSTWRGRHR